MCWTLRSLTLIPAFYHCLPSGLSCWYHRGILGVRQFPSRLTSSVFGLSYWVRYRRNITNENIRLLTAHPILVRPAPEGVLLIQGGPRPVLERAEKLGSEWLQICFCCYAL